MKLRAALVVAGGVILFAYSAIGAISAVILDFGSARDWLVILTLTLPFPIFLVSILSLRVATAALCVFFVLQWLVRISFDQHPKLSSPFDWWRGDMLAIGICLVSIGWVIGHMKSKQ
jgi:hypothetical protein